MTEPNSSIYGGVQDVAIDNDVVVGLVAWLKTKTDLMNLLGHYLDLPLFEKPFIFPHVSLMSVQGKQTNSLVVKNAGDSGMKDNSNLHFPKVTLEFYCDPLRDDDGNISELSEAYSRVTYIYNQFDKVMNRPAALPGSDSKIEYWGTVRTIECKRLSELAISISSSVDGPLLGEVSYGVAVG